MLTHDGHKQSCRIVLIPAHTYSCFFFCFVECVYRRWLKAVHTSSSLDKPNHSGIICEFVNNVLGRFADIGIWGANAKAEAARFVAFYS